MEAEKLAWNAEKSGRGGSMIKELRLLRGHASKTSESPLLSKDGSVLMCDEDKLKR